MNNLDIIWEVIEQMNWSVNKDYNKQKKYLMSHYSIQECESFRNMISPLYNDLYSVLDKDDKNRRDSRGEGYGLGDDSFGDLIHEIIGRGKTFYNNALINPEIAYQMAINYDFKESFIYSFPYKEDWELLLPENYLRHVIEEKETFNKIRWEKYNEEIKSLVKEYNSILEETIEQNNFDIIFQNQDRFQKLCKKIKQESDEHDFGYLQNQIQNYKNYIKTVKALP